MMNSLENIMLDCFLLYFTVPYLFLLSILGNSSSKIAGDQLHLEIIASQGSDSSSETLLVVGVPWEC